MKHLNFWKTGILIAAFALPLAADSVTSVSNQRVPVLLELFTSEGCSSCPPADRLLESFDQGQPFANADLIVLSEHVDYWNHLGWADPYSSAFFSNRQRQYAKHLASDDVYTPELVVDGVTGFVGSERGEANAAIKEAARNAKFPVAVSATRAGKSGSVHVESGALAGKAAHGDLYIVLASDHARSQVARGENAGRDLSHVAVAYSISKVADWDSANALSRDFNVTLKPGATRVIAFVQDRNSGKILAVAQTKL